ncbi:MAG: type 4a pilus biogenesis protein PilO [Pseudomonadota bacterium]
MTLLEELSNIDVNDLGALSRRAKLVLAALLALILIALGYNFVITPKSDQLEQVQRQEQVLRDQFLEKKALAINLDAYKAQMVEAEQTFELLKRQLPNESEIPDLLVDMTQVGVSRGLRFEQFKLGNTFAKDFYAEKLVNIKANGSYHQIAGFVSDLAALPRIINVASFKLRRQDEEQNILTFDAVTKTYHYLEETYVDEDLRR